MSVNPLWLEIRAEPRRGGFVMKYLSSRSGRSYVDHQGHQVLRYLNTFRHELLLLLQQAERLFSALDLQLLQDLGDVASDRYRRNEQPLGHVGC